LAKSFPSVSQTLRNFGPVYKSGFLNGSVHNPVLVSIDDVKSLGIFLEIEAHAKEEKDIKSKKKDIMALAKKLGAEESIRKSYLELLLEKKEQ
jgi:predicted adenylyl cyclase CyaB